MQRLFFHVMLLVFVGIVAQCAAGQQAQGLADGDVVALCGDSITEQKDYSVNIESYLLMCQPKSSLQTVQFGWGGETSWGFKARMANDALRFQPTVATTCYGMNDGGYGPLNENTAKLYRESQTEIVRQFKAAGVRFIVVGSPGCVDSNTFGNDTERAKVYNQTLSQLRDISKEVAAAEGVTFANVFDPMIDVMAKAKAKYGNAYHLAGGDGVHPAQNGHLVMAYAFLKALGCDGAIGTIEYDWNSKSLSATPGHSASLVDDAIQVVSTKYPFCFTGDPQSPDATTGVIEFLPFNDELNRLMLIVKNAKAKKIKVTWGENSKVFAAADLASGINLAAEFTQNPFSDAFEQVKEKIREQQNLETHLVKSLLNRLPQYKQFAPEENDSIDRIAVRLVEKDKEARAESSNAIQPLTHTIKLEVVE